MTFQITVTNDRPHPKWLLHYGIVRLEFHSCSEIMNHISSYVHDNIAYQDS